MIPRWLRWLVADDETSARLDRVDQELDMKESPVPVNEEALVRKAMDTLENRLRALRAKECLGKE